MKKQQLIILSITSVLACGIILAVFGLSGWFGHQGTGFSSQLLPDWKYRRPIILSGHQEDLTDYQVKVELTPSNFDYSHCQSDLDDIRFTDANDNRLLDFWIETASTTATSTIWVKVPALSADKESKIYMYYGNAGASGASDGDATFEFFDDFSGDLNKWTRPRTSGVSAIESGELSISVDSTGQEARETITTFSPPFILEYKFQSQVLGNYRELMMQYFYDTYSTFGNSNIEYRDHAPDKLVFVISSQYFIEITVNSDWHRMKVIYLSDGGKLYLDDMVTEKISISGEAPATTGKISFDANRPDSTWSNVHFHVDDVRVRKYASPEPSATVGSEEIQMTPILHLRMNEGSGTTVYDSTPNNLDANFGSGNNAPTWVTQ